MTTKSNFFITPPTHRELLTKIDVTGATVLKAGKFKNRFGITPGYRVLPNGVLVDDKQLRILEGLPAGRKKVKKVSYTRTGQDSEPDPGQQKPRKANEVNPKKIRHRTIAIVNAQRDKKMYAFTITFPPNVDDDMAYQLFNTWLTVCRQSLKLKDYLWVREYQKIGTVHFHMLVPHYLHVKSANRAMQQCIITQINKGTILGYHIKQAKKYQGVHIGKNDKTKKVTNFASPKARRQLLNYMLKYMSKSKQSEGQKDGHYAWHNSRAFSKMITSMALTEAEARQLKIRSQLNMDSTWKTEWCTHILWKEYSPPDFLIDHLSAINRNILDHLDGKKIQMPVTLTLN